MAEEKAPDLTKVTAAEFLLFSSDLYEGRGRFKTGFGNVEGAAALVPKNPNLPEVAIQASQGLDQPDRASLSVGSDLLRYSRKYEGLDKGAGGPRTTDTFEGGVGPLKGYFQKSGQPGNQDSRTTAYGGQLNLGPVNVSANRSLFSQEDVDPRFAQYYTNTRFDNQKDNIGLNLRLPVGRGAVTGGVGREFRTQRGPQQSRQETRPTAQSPNVTTYSAGYEGKVGPGILGLQGNLTDVRNVGTEKSVEGSYNINDPFGLGGNLSATGSYNNPIGGKSAAEAMLTYRLKFGGGR
tara:strand:- start:836 stop:1714 length:879 start_codon:yes stop_codon:yes gene_type:complete